MIRYSHIFQTGLQSLLAVACGWACGRWRVLDAESTVATTNTLVLKFCIPCLQIWLLACHTDMRQPGNWRALAIFFLWSVSLQCLLALQQLLSSRRLRLAQLGVDSLLLTTNNTGILGPVVLEAAVGQAYAPLGMLATVVLYFQQLPSAQLLFQLQRDRAASSSSSPPAAKQRASPFPPAAGTEEQQLLLTSREDGMTVAARRHGSADSLQHHHQQQYDQQLGGQQRADAEWGQQQQLQPTTQHRAGSGNGSSNSSWSAVADVVSLLFQNSLVWSTGASLLLSSLGSSLLLDPAQPSALRHLAFVEQLLGWFAQTTAPLTLFTTGLWMQGNSAAQQQQQKQQPHCIGSRVPTEEAAVAAAAPEEPVGALGMQELCVYLLLRCTLAPATMVLLCWLFGVTGDLAHALVILALLPVAQTAFVVCKAADTGMQAVSVVMVASLLVMLPQLMLVLALLEWLGVLSASV